MTVEQQPRPGGGADVETLTATILTAVERQLTRYFSAMSQQADAARQLAEQSRDEMRAELAERFPKLESTIDEQRAANDSYQRALQVALEERLAEFANHQHWRMNDLEDKVAALPTGLDAEAMMEVRQTVRDDMERSFNAINARLDELVNVNRRFDEQSSALVQQVNDTTTALAQRMDEGDARTTLALDEKLTSLQAGLADTFAGVETQVGELASTLLAKLDSVESRGTDRLLELEARINEDQGTKIANLEATIGRIGGGFDDAMIALNQRLLALENRLFEVDDRIGEMGERLAKVDEGALDEVRSEMSRAVGEATLVRIELDRMVASTNETIDKQTIRMAEIEGLLADQMDVSTAVQLERLDELERQMQLIDPAALGRSIPGAVPSAAPSGAAPGDPITGSTRAMPSMSLNPRPSGADTNAQDDASRETEPTFSTH